MTLFGPSSFSADCTVNGAESNFWQGQLSFTYAGVFPDTRPIAMVYSVPEFIWGISDEEIIVDAGSAAALCRDLAGGRFSRYGRRNSGLGASRQRSRSLHPRRDATVQRVRPGRRSDRPLPEDQATPA